MRDRWMKGVVGTLSVLGLVASVAFAWSRDTDESQAQSAAAVGDAAEDDGQPKTPAAEPAADKPSGRAVFESRCQRCHSLEETVALIKKKPADARRSYLTGLLDRHFPPPPAERPPLVDYLLEETARAK